MCTFVRIRLAEVVVRERSDGVENTLHWKNKKINRYINIHFIFNNNTHLTKLLKLEVKGIEGEKNF